jgi:hypothetical protein
MTPSQYKPYAGALQAEDVIFGDQFTGVYDSSGNPIYKSIGFPGSLFAGGNGAVALTPGSLLANPSTSGSSNFGSPVALDPLQFLFDSSGALHLAEQIADNLTATGSLQTNALLLTSLVNVFANVAAGTGAILFPVQKGMVIEVWNFGAHVLALYPPGGGIFNAGAPNAAVGIAPSSNLKFRCRSAAAGASLWLAG